MNKKACGLSRNEVRLTRMNLIHEARAFLQRLVDEGYAEDQILLAIKQMLAWLTEVPPPTMAEAELPAITRAFVERLLNSGIPEAKILDALNQVAILLIKSRRKNHEH